MNPAGKMVQMVADLPYDATQKYPSCQEYDIDHCRFQIANCRIATQTLHSTRQSEICNQKSAI